MPNPTRISLPRVNYNFDAKACVPVLTVMLNKVEKDYSTVDELCDHDELSKFNSHYWDAISILTERKKRCIIYTMRFVYPFDVFKL